MKIDEYEGLHEKKRHSSPLFPYNTYLCSIPLDFTQVPPHWHEDIELIVIKKGLGTVSVDLVPHLVRAGDLVVVRPGQIHAIRQYEAESMEYENILFQPGLLYSQSHDGCTLNYFQPYFDLTLDLCSHITANFSGYAALEACITAIDELCSDRPRYYELMIKSHLFAFFYHLFSQQENRIPAKSRASLEKAKEMMTYIEDHYAQPVTVGSAAEYMGFSPSHFMKVFRQTMGSTFTAYLNEYRLTMAGKLLLTTEDGILDVAQQAGFGNLSYFNRLFKARYQMTPSQYRQTRKKGALD